MDATISHPQYITDENGQKTAVILPLETYRELLEDLSDLATVAERRNEKTMGLEDLIVSLKADGLL